MADMDPSKSENENTVPATPVKRKKTGPAKSKTMKPRKAVPPDDGIST